MPGPLIEDAGPVDRPRCAIAPTAPEALVDAVVAGGGTVVDLAEAEALVWTDPLDVDGLSAALRAAPRLGWVQLPFAGVDRFALLLDADRTWTSAKGAFAAPVAEHALALGLAGLRGLPERARARRWGPPAGRQLLGAEVILVGGGGITEALLGLLGPFGVTTTVVRRRGTPVPGATRVVPPGALLDVLPGAALVVLTLALTDETRGIIGGQALARMDADAWLVNVARGEHVVTDALVEALTRRAIGGAALDVTDPEPLPPGHPLWDLDNCLVTPHMAATPAMAEPLLAERVRRNVERYRRHEPLLGLVDPTLGY